MKCHWQGPACLEEPCVMGLCLECCAEGDDAMALLAQGNCGAAFEMGRMEAERERLRERIGLLDPLTRLRVTGFGDPRAARTPQEFIEAVRAAGSGQEPWLWD